MSNQPARAQSKQRQSAQQQMHGKVRIRVASGDRPSSQIQSSACPLSPTSSEFPSPPPRLVFSSPRLDFEDDQLFPSAQDLAEPEQRWAYISGLAGSHHQDGKVMRLRAPLTPRALPLGMPSQAASRVVTLHLPPPEPPRLRIRRPSSFLDRRPNGRENAEEDDSTRLPQWLDVVSRTFPNLRHLHTNDSNNSGHLRRLYVLYRLPDLESIDGIPVTTEERRLARPLSPNGQPVSALRWLTDDKEVQQPLVEMKQDEKKEAEDIVRGKQSTKESSMTTTHKPTNVEVDLAGRLTEVALSPHGGRHEAGGDSNRKKNSTQADELILETSSSVVAPGCGWMCGQFLRADEVKKKLQRGTRKESLSKDNANQEKTDSRERVPLKKEKTVGLKTLEAKRRESLSPSSLNRDTGLANGSNSFEMRPQGMLPPRLVLDAAQDPASTLVIKMTAPPAPSARLQQKQNRCPPPRSLSSPFPIQFRDRGTEKSRPCSSQSPVERYSNAGIKRLKNASLSRPVPMQRTKSSPTVKTNRNLPPPCPTGGKNLHLMSASNDRRSSKLFKKQNARRTSIISYDSDEDEEVEPIRVLESLGSA